MTDDAPQPEVSTPSPSDDARRAVSTAAEGASGGPTPASGATATIALPTPGPLGSAADPGLTTTEVLPPMRAGASSTGSSSRPASPVPISWQSWPVVDSVWELLGLATVLVVVPIVAWSVSSQVVVTVLCAAAAAVAVWRNFVPTVYEINALGITQRTFGRTRRIPWMSIDRFVVGRRGVFLSSDGAPLEVFRGLYLPWGDNREQLLTTLRYYLPRSEAASDR